VEASSMPMAEEQISKKNKGQEEKIRGKRS